LLPAVDKRLNEIKFENYFLRMIRITIVIALTALTISGCSNSNKKSMATQMISEKEIKQDSTGGYAPVNGLKMYYEIHGTGAPLVLIHGGGSTIGTSFGRILPSLAKTHKVIAVEMQAHGHTADIDRPLSFEQDADDIAELLRQLNISKADIMGFSNGASTTLEMAIRHPELVNKIIVASTFYKKDGAPSWFWDMMEHATFEGMPQPLKDAYLEINPDTNALYAMYKRDVARMQSFKDIKEADMKAIRAPALIIAGDNDVVRPEHAVEMYRLLSHARLAILPGVHGEYIGEITTPQDTDLITGTVSMIEKFLSEPMPKAN
jgi:pimeloyl-ACP methyl ester carboxylesterase